MVGDINERIDSAQEKIRKLATKVPGFGGYLQKDQRREADKLLRLHVARQYQEQLARLGDIQETLINDGDLRAMMALERAVTKLQLLIDRIKTASYGYSGLFEGIKVDEDTLDALYDFDQAMVDGVDTLAQQLDELSGLIEGGEPTGPAANALVRALETLNAEYSQRQDVFLD